MSRGENILPDYLVTDEVASFSRWTGLAPEGLADIMRFYQDSGSPHHAAAAECLHRIVEKIKSYCKERGVTKYCHWFNSWTGTPAYKRDNIDLLSPKTLFQGEPDASSKPSGGLRSTYEARGYTVWDSKGSLFILNGTTLCIPTLFISYRGESLDLKSPTLRAKATLAQAVERFLEAAEPGCYDWSKTKVRTFAGPEQEYFLLPSALASQRPDLVHCGATVVGNPPPRNQQLEEHYLGSIPLDVHDFFEELNNELAKLGIVPATDHNEVAPRQFEFAPLHDEAVRAADQNLLAMHILDEVARRRGWLALTHEKPFSGLNGSGKHLNFSVGLVDKASGELVRNLFAPPKETTQRLTFLVTMAATIVGIKRRARLLRASVASRSNDLRLGGNEAPPAVISVYMGETLREVAGELLGQEQAESNDGQQIDLALEGVPLVARDNTDRNRTSPIAFTGNKFEFRMPGADSAVYLPLAVWSAATAEVLEEVAAKVAEKPAGDSTKKVLRRVFRELMHEAEPVIFDGDCYSQQWRDEANRRGLSEARDTANALSAFVDEEQQAFLNRAGIWEHEVSSAYFRVKMDQYAKLVAIEAATLVEMVGTAIRPAAQTHQTGLAARVAALHEAQDIALRHGHQATDALKQHLDQALDSLNDFGALVSQLDGLYDRLLAALATLDELNGDARRGCHAAESVAPAMGQLRDCCNQLERILPDELYPYPTCSELLYGED
jgi:glutamine synthetase